VNFRLAAEGLNMGSALLHVLSDSLRSATTLVEAILILSYPEVPSSAFDAWATLAVTATILAALAKPVADWCGEFRRLWCRQGGGAYSELDDLDGQTRQPT
jgi:hypothetical protein